MNTVGAPVISFQFPPAPRKVIRSNRNSLGFWITRVLFLPFLAVGVISALLAILAICWALWGKSDSASIIGKHLSYARKQTSPTFIIDYVWRSPDGEEKYQTGSVSSGYYKSLREDLLHYPVPVPVRVLRVGSYTYLYALPEGDSPWPHVLIVTVFALFWNGITLLGVWGLLMAPWQECKLLREGTVTQGAITQAIRRRNWTQCRYSYKVDDVEYTGRLNCSTRTDIPLVVGTVLPIFYNPKKPGSSLAYHCSDYEVSQEDSGAAVT